MKPIDESTPVVTTDVVVIGFGAAGACAAITAREQGADVIALDRANGGGATALSGGIIYAGAGTSVQAAAGVEDTVEQMMAYLRLEVGDAVSEETLEKFVRTSPEMIQWLSDQGVPFDSSLCPYKTSFPNNSYYLYFSGSENSGAYRRRTPPVQRGHRVKGKGTSGKQLYKPLAKSAQNKGVQLLPHTMATELIQDESGRVTGVVARTMQYAPARIRRLYTAACAVSAKPGIYYPPLRKQMERYRASLEERYARPIRVMARRGVVIGAGGFIANTDWVNEFAPQYANGLPLGTSGDDGSGIALGQSVGAIAERMDNVSAWRFITPPSAFIGSIVVDAKGRRIIDESRYGAALGQAIVRNHDAKAWILADADLMSEARRNLIKQTLWFQRAQVSALMTLDSVRGKSLRDVAEAAGIDAEGLIATVEAHNDAIDSGTEDPVGKPAELTRRAVRAPFTLLNISVRPSVINPTPMLTLGGVRVDENSSAVLDESGDPIPGLYAAGRTAIGVCSDSYVSGLSIADCVFSGRRAGRHAAQQASDLADSWPDRESA
ncbi:FAD-binding protein [Aldersonia sp. NBC_00410]|uniref:FAD-binding protein n=1 Tax=Aldersonia sp. NBC_00410 TaxID=2975954 RepID=UPI002257F144|nr:FAD-binding protein [Aldersonia sp. NBC_00410]MCX5044725.1 FAD-binding protein [Aldersonia sp. NBC_00410]